MVHEGVSENYIHFGLMYMEDNILLVLPLKYLINEDGNTTTPFKITTGKKPSIMHLHVLFYPCAV